MVDDPIKSGNNEYIVLEGEDETFKIRKRDLVWQNTGDHTHHYLPDFTDETTDFVALTCQIQGCVHGRLVRKKGKDFMKWLETSRKSQASS